MLSVFLNVITLTIVAALFILFFSLYKKRKNKSDTAHEVALELLKDPLIVSRAYFTEPATGDIGNFEPFSSSGWSEDDWLHGFSHKEA